MEEVTRRLSLVSFRVPFGPRVLVPVGGPAPAIVPVIAPVGGFLPLASGGQKFIGEYLQIKGGDIFEYPSHPKISPAGNSCVSFEIRTHSPFSYEAQDEPCLSSSSPKSVCPTSRTTASVLFSCTASFVALAGVLSRVFSYMVF